MKNILLLVFVGWSSLVAVAQSRQSRATMNAALRPFYHGVASGDPTSDRVIIWTRCTPDSGNQTSITVYWQVATDLQFNNIVNYGKAIATDATDFTVKVDVCGLQPSTFYYFMFSAGGRNSIIARTKTAPDATRDNDSVRFAVASCASWEHGYFNAYENICMRNDVDAVIHLGDYIYEYESGGFANNSVTAAGRVYTPPTEVYTEAGYEVRHSQYKLDDQLRRMHQLFPFISVWDDHETCNDAYRDGAENHTPGTEGNYTDRKRVATATYFHWMPLRKPDPFDTIRIFRKLRYGKLLDLIMLDTRLYDRDLQNGNQTNNPNRHMIGPVERTWFFQQLSDTTTRWKIIGNQVMFAPMLGPFGLILNADQWDGYAYERNLIINYMQNHAKNVVILTGDIHTSWCNDIPGIGYNSGTGAGSVGVEFVCPSVTSLNFPINLGVNVIKALNPHIKYVNLNDHGYYLVDVKKGKVQADYKFHPVTTLHQPDQNGPSYYVNYNEHFLRSSNTAVVAPTISAPNPPLLPDTTLVVTKLQLTHRITTDNKTGKTMVVIPDPDVCPAINMNIIDNAHHGSGNITGNGQNIFYQPQLGYQGPDTILAVVCETAQPTVCDTVRIFITVQAKVKADTVIVHLEANNTYSDCFSFDDVSASALLHIDTPQYNAFSFGSDTCFQLIADSKYCGFEVLRGTACEPLYNVCDTVVYIFKINHPAQMQTLVFDTLKNNVLNYCFRFDDLLAVKGGNQLVIAPKHGNFSLPNDSCARFAPYYNFTGSDTVVIRACDNCAIPVCDTLRFIFHFRELYNAIVETDRMIVLGMYPNPVEEALTIQYYLYKEESVLLQITDALGRMVKQQTLPKVEAGVQHAQLQFKDLPAATYDVRISAGKQQYNKRVVKR